MSIEVNQSDRSISAFLSQHNVGVLATADNNGKPHAATVYFTYDKQLNMYFITKKATQKNRNLQANAYAAIAIFDAASQATVQAEGPVAEVTEQHQKDWIFRDIYSVAAQTSQGAVPPVTQLMAGDYIVYKLQAPVLRKATYSPPDPAASSSNIFEVVYT